MPTPQYVNSVGYMASTGDGPAARPKERPQRKPAVDYRRLHKGSMLEDSPIRRRASSESEKGSPEGTPGIGSFGALGSAADAGPDLGHQSAEKVLNDLDREIEELEESLKVVNSQIKAASLRKEQQKRTERLAKLRRELFTAEQQLQKAEEEG